MKRGNWGGAAVAAVLIFVGVLAANADAFDTLQELCDIPQAHQYCKEGGGCHLISSEHMALRQQQEQMTLMQAYEAGIAEGRRQAEAERAEKK